MILEIRHAVQIDEILKNARQPVTMQLLQERLEVSARTVQRAMEKMRNLLGAPIEWNREYAGYQYSDKSFELKLPGVWFNQAELHALLVSYELLDQAQSDFIDQDLVQLKQRIHQLLKDNSGPEISRRIKIIPIAQRGYEKNLFRCLVEGCLRRRRLRLGYYSRSRSQSLERIVSPQRLVHYKSNWYLDAYCHNRQAYRTFAVDSIESASLLTQEAMDMNTEIDELQGETYGIFAGTGQLLAEIEFSAFAAQWVRYETWHPKQHIEELDSGGIILRLPYQNPTELIMDLMRYGPEARVLAPEALRLAVVEKLKKSLESYQADSF